MERGQMHKFWKVTPDEVLAITKERVEKLRVCSLDELCALPATTRETVFVEDQRVDVCTYRDTLPDQRVRIVVQSYRLRYLGAGTMTAEGFIMSPDGSISSEPAEMMYQFT